MSQDIEPFVISYAINQPINLQLWNSNFCPIFIFEINEYLEGNIKNIMYSLFRIVAFIKQHKLKGKTKKISLKSLNLALLLGILFQPSMRLDGIS